MLQIENAPEKGTIYATFITEMVYKKYEKLSDIEEYLKKDGLLELHLFDKEKELRFIKTRGKGLSRYEISDSKESYDDTYCESLYAKDEKIEVVNYIQYDENDMIKIVNYRLKEVE